MKLQHQIRREGRGRKGGVEQEWRREKREETDACLDSGSP